LKKLTQTRLLLVAACLVIVLPAAFVGFTVSKKTESLWFGKYDANAREAYDFELQAAGGETLRLSDLRGKIVLLNFGFTNCPSICPAVLANLAAVYRKLTPADRDNVRVLFVTLDPARDTAEKLGEYVPFFEASFVGLTGDAAKIAAIAKAYGVFYQKAPSDSNDPETYMIDHSTETFVIDSSGKLRMVFRLDQLPESDRVVADIHRIRDLR